ncbi:barstar family protein [Janthinobacterium sp. SUN073]|uniref:barstar family protein n=1 Tax=Janthinobacterium sp. SUN073 TaxID=3004102 RepID=UPI00339D8BEF
MKSIRINSHLIVNEETFHSVFSEACGFPDFYGRNMNAWIDCMGYLDEPLAQMSSVHVAPGESLALIIDGASSFKTRCPALHDELIECAASVNRRCAEAGRAPLLTITMHT